MTLPQRVWHGTWSSFAGASGAVREVAAVVAGPDDVAAMREPVEAGLAVAFEGPIASRHCAGRGRGATWR